MEVLSRLGHRMDGSWVPLPDWAQWMVELGGTLGRRSQSRARAVVILAVPTRNFVSALVSLGVVVERATDPGHSLSLEQHFLRLATTLPGAAVNVRVGDRVLEGVLVGIRDMGAGRGEIIGVRITNEDGGNESRLVPKHACYRIQFADEEHDLGERRRTHRAKGLSSFVEECVGPATATRLTERARTDCVVYGTRSVLSAELTEQEFLTQRGASGALLDIVRAKPLVGVGLPHRMCLFSSTKHQPTQGPEVPIVVFDGARTFLSGWKRASRTSCVAVLDRTESKFVEAVDLALSFLRGGEVTLVDVAGTLDPVPQGLEALFLERCA